MSNNVSYYYHSFLTIAVLSLNVVADLCLNTSGVSATQSLGKTLLKLLFLNPNNTWICEVYYNEEHPSVVVFFSDAIHSHNGLVHSLCVALAGCIENEPNEFGPHAN